MKHRFGQQVSWTIFFTVVRPFVRLIICYKYRRERHIKGPALIMCNHNMDIDIGLLGLSYRQSMRVVASEHIFRLGILTSLIRLFFAPIVRMKGKTELGTVREILDVLKKGGRVCVFPEGNRSFNGLTGEIAQASASLARVAKCQLITYRIEGGYLKHPRWAIKGRRGFIGGGEVGRYPAEQLAQMNTGEILELIRRDLYEDAFERQKANSSTYTGKRLAERIEVALYLCPKCGRIGTIQSRDDRFFCPCGLCMRYTETGTLKNLESDETRFTTVAQWDAWQQSMTAELVCRAQGETIASDEGVSLYQVTPCRKDELIETGSLTISKASMAVGSVMFPLEDISDLAIVGPNTLVFELRSGSYYEIRSKGAYSALKYRRIYLHCKKTAKGECGVPSGGAQR